jgi:hypothetical protein
MVTSQHISCSGKRVCMIHWILLNIQIDKSRVEVMDSLNKDQELWSDMKAMLQK